jgi:NADPH:quinone reductase-like Zn-dependent oxidoreductase
MKAFVHSRYGPPEVLQMKVIPDPVPGEHEILIRVHAATVNRTDDGLLRADPFISRFFTGLLRPKNIISGSEFAGQVHAIGSAVTLFKPGDRIFGFCEFGAHAELLKIAEDGPVALIPEKMSYEQAAPLTEGAHYALNYIRKAAIQSGQRVLIYGATGAIGTAALQIIKAIGAEVTAVCDTKRMELVKSLGADKVVDYTTGDFTQTDIKFHVVFDAVGKSSFGKCKPLLEDKGIYGSTDLGYLAQNPLLALWTPLLGGKKVLFPIPAIDKEMIVYLKSLAETEKFQPVIDRKFSFEEIPEAFRYVNRGQKTGNVVIIFNPNGKHN